MNKPLSDKLQKFAQERKLNSKENQREAHRNRLKQLIRKKMTTILVGTIDEFEQAFGYNWGHGLENDDKTDEQLDLAVAWNICRDKIFDRGNIQIRGMEKEIDTYEVELIRYESTFKTIKENGNG